MLTFLLFISGVIMLIIWSAGIGGAVVMIIGAVLTAVFGFIILIALLIFIVGIIAIAISDS